MLFSCERDDICADNVTPYLIIRFMDLEDPDSTNDVVDLQVQYIPDEGEQEEDFEANLFSSATTTDSITILLPTFKNTARFKFIQNYDTEINEEGEEIDDLSDAEIDIVKFTYTINEEYVNRACGFRVLYGDLDVEITEGDGETITKGFIKSKDVKNETIENEEEAHIHFLH